MMLAAPEFIEAERIDLFDKIEVAAELQHRMLADRVMRGEEGSEFEACHGFLSGLIVLEGSTQTTGWESPRQSRKGRCGLFEMVPCAQPMDRRGSAASKSANALRKVWPGKPANPRPYRIYTSGPF